MPTHAPIISHPRATQRLTRNRPRLRATPVNPGMSTAMLILAPLAARERHLGGGKLMTTGVVAVLIHAGIVAAAGALHVSPVIGYRRWAPSPASGMAVAVGGQVSVATVTREGCYGWCLWGWVFRGWISCRRVACRRVAGRGSLRWGVPRRLLTR